MYKYFLFLFLFLTSCNISIAPSASLSTPCEEKCKNWKSIGRILEVQYVPGRMFDSEKTIVFCEKRTVVLPFILTITLNSEGEVGIACDREWFSCVGCKLRYLIVK